MFHQTILVIFLTFSVLLRLSVFLSLKSKIEDIRLNQEKEAEKVIRLHFQMEQIVYCQDQVYKEALKTIREKEAEKNC